MKTRPTPAGEARTPEVTVAMPARNSAPFIREAIESILHQDGVDLELIVVDDGSTDETAAIVESMDDPRITLLKNPTRRGIGHCHNRIVAASSAPFIAHMDSDDVALPGVLRKLLDKIQSDDRIGQVHCYLFWVDEKGHITRDEFRRQRSWMLRTRPQGLDYKRALLVHGSVMNGLRTYRKAVFDVVGPFNEDIRYGIDYHMALRVVDRFDIQIVPEFLYCSRKHPNSTTKGMRFGRFRFWWQAVVFCYQLGKQGKAEFLKQPQYRPYKLLSIRLCRTLNLHQTPSWVTALRRFPRAAWSRITGRLVMRPRKRLYEFLIRHPSWWPLPAARRKRSVQGEKRLAYYTWRFPVLSQTFVRREIRSLKERGVALEVIADQPGDMPLDEEITSYVKRVTFLKPLDKQALRRYRWSFLARNPLRYASLSLYVTFHRYAPYKSIGDDRSIFRRAVHLAGVLRDHNVHHVHCAWADRTATIALLAARLLGIPYSVQARAHDIHRHDRKPGLAEKFLGADFVITNSEYNRTHIASMLPDSKSCKVHSILEGVDVERFNPGPRKEPTTEPFRILCVARLIEEKGILHLLRACAILRERGHNFHCEIIGGPEQPFYTNYYVEIKKLFRKLQLKSHVSLSGVKPFADVLERYQESNLFVLPCVTAENGGRDISPHALLEAMAMKLPVISTHQTAIPEIVEHGINGILVPPGDETALADAMIELMKKPGVRAELADNARKTVEERFNIGANIESLHKLFLGQHLVAESLPSARTP